MNADLERLDRILSGLPIEDRLWISPRLEPPGAVQRRRLDARDAALRELWAQLDGNATVRGEWLARRLRHYLGQEFARDKSAGGPPKDCPPLRALLYQIVFLNDGISLGIRQIKRIAAGARTPITLP